METVLVVVIVCIGSKSSISSDRLSAADGEDGEDVGMRTWR